MVVSSRVTLGVALGLVGLAVVVGPSLGQQGDGSVRRAATQGGTPAATKPAPVPPTFATVDIAAVLKKYNRVKVNSEEFSAAAAAKKNELMKLYAEAQEHQQMLAKFTPNSVDFKKHENRITELKAKMEAEREQAEREFSLKEAEMFATLYKEIQTMVARVAKWKGYTYVLRVSNDPITGSDPRSALAAIDRSVVYADPVNDITEDVIVYLNRDYQAKGGPAPKSAMNAKPNGS